MLSEPKHGWTDLSIPGLTAPISLSYLTDLPVIWPETLADAVRNNRPAALYGDTEGSEVYITVHHEFLSVILDDGEPELTAYRADMTGTEFIWKLLEDLRAWEDAWVTWNPDTEFMKDLTERRELVQQARLDLESAIT